MLFDFILFIQVKEILFPELFVFFKFSTKKFEIEKFYFNENDENFLYKKKLLLLMKDKFFFFFCFNINLYLH